MARIKGDKPYGLQFESTVQADLDARKEIPLLADLTTANTWTALNGAPNHYVGMTTFCLENKTRYELLGDDPTDIGNWKVMGGGSSTAYDFKASDYVTDKTNATAGLQALFDDVAKSELDMPNVLIEAGHYVVDNFIKATNKNFNLTAKGATIDGSKSGLLYDGVEFHGIFQVGGDYTQTTTLAASVTLGDKSMSLSNVLNATVGDVVILQDRRENSYAVGLIQFQSEMFYIDNIEGNVISSTKNIRHSYSVAETNVILLKMHTVNIYGLKVIAPDGGTSKSVLSFFARNCIESSFVDINATGSNWGNVCLENCLNSRIIRSSCVFPSNEELGLNYGVMVNASENIIVDSAITRTQRHSITFGSAPSSRDVVSRNCIVTNSIIDTFSDKTAAMDCHEGCEDMIISNNPMINGLTLRCKNTLVDANNITSRYGNRSVELIALAGGIFTLSRNNFNTATTAENDVCIYYYGEDNAVNKGGLVLDSNKGSMSKSSNSRYFLNYLMSYVDGVVPAFVKMFNNNIDVGASGVFAYFANHIGSVEIKGNNTQGRVFFTSSVRGLSDFILDGNTFRSSDGSAINYNILQQGWNANTLAAKYIIKNNVFDNFTLNPLYFISFASDLIVQNNLMLRCKAPFGLMRFVKETEESQAVNTTIMMLDNHLNIEDDSAVNWFYQARYCDIISSRNTSNYPKEISRFDADSTITNPDILTKRLSEQGERCNGTMIFVDGIPQWWDATKSAWVDATGTNV